MNPNPSSGLSKPYCVINSGFHSTANFRPNELQQPLFSAGEEPDVAGSSGERREPLDRSGSSQGGVMTPAPQMSSDAAVAGQVTSDAAVAANNRVRLCNQAFLVINAARRCFGGV